MSKKNRKGVVYSTDPDHSYDYIDDEQDDTLDPSDQELSVILDRSHRKGKSVTIISGFVGTDDDRDSLGKLLKKKCGVGGSVKDGEIIVQGDVRQKVKDILTKEGYGKIKVR